MATWDELSTDAFEAAISLRQGKRWRSSVSRAYYATYAKSVATLIRVGLTMPARGNPSHGALPELLRNHLTRLSPIRRANLAIAVANLYRLRVGADYGPRILIDENSAFDAMGHMTRAFRDLKEAAQ